MAIFSTTTTARSPLGPVTVLPADAAGTPRATSPRVRVAKVENLPADFAAGVDVSMVLSLEESGVVFRDASGAPVDLFDVLRDSGITHVRVRVWNDPFDEAGRGYGGGNVGVERATLIGARATQAGLKVLVNFHYSDFWADPGYQLPPKAWQGFTAEQTAAAAAKFTSDSLRTMLAAGVDVAMVQVGNETNTGVAGLTEWADMCAFFSATGAAVRDATPQALLAVHFANPEVEGSYEFIAKTLDEHAVDYDVFASSYYPFWHGTLENLTRVLTHIATTYGKHVMVVETSWVRTLESTDGCPNVVATRERASQYEISVQGQSDAVRAVIQAVADVGEAGIGVFYWEPAWLPVGPASELERNRSLWERFGSGWAASFATGYYPMENGRKPGGDEWENHSLFASDGTALDSLRVFEYARTGTGGATT